MYQYLLTYYPALTLERVGWLGSWFRNPTCQSLGSISWGCEANFDHSCTDFGVVPRLPCKSHELQDQNRDVATVPKVRHIEIPWPTPKTLPRPYFCSLFLYGILLPKPRKHIVVTFFQTFRMWQFLLSGVTAIAAPRSGKSGWAVWKEPEIAQLFWSVLRTFGKISRNTGLSNWPMNLRPGLSAQRLSFLQRAGHCLSFETWIQLRFWSTAGKLGNLSFALRMYRAGKPVIGWGPQGLYGLCMSLCHVKMNKQKRCSTEMYARFKQTSWRFQDVTFTSDKTLRCADVLSETT